MPSIALETGLRATVSFRVDSTHLASEIGSGDTHVLATPMLAAGMEAAAVKAVASALEPGLTTVGAHLDIYHRVASAPGMTVTFEAVLEKISPNGRGLEFRVHAWDEGGDIGHGKHERVIVIRENFERQAQARAAGLPAKSQKRDQARI